ncbi:Smr domain-containing protein, partial [Rhizoctonia solani]
LRAQARLEGDKMAMAFTASRRAHDEGDKARAKQLSDLGKEHEDKMHKLNQEAANQIFKEKNEGRPADEIDLHGLRVKEAVSRLSKFLRDAPVAGQTTVRVITGKGLHSSGDPQIIPAVQESLRRSGLRHHTDPNNTGVVVVELGPRSPVSD